MEKIRWGILGCGKIANKFAADLAFVEDAHLVAVASRDGQRAISFADVYGAPFAFDSYEALVQSAHVDVIYIATPHGMHHEHALLCLRHKKAVLCEKALALNSSQVAAMIREAKANHVFLMEAFWTKFLPQYQKVSSLIQSGEIGDIRMVQADFGFRADDPTPQRFYDPLLGGGALLDIGIYPVWLAVTLLGRPSEIKALMQPYPTGVDRQIAINFKFENGALALLSASFEAETPVEAVIVGTKGAITMRNRFHNTTSSLELAMGKEPGQPVRLDKSEGNGYQYEARHVGDCLRKQLTESPVMQHADSLLLMETLDRVRQQCGIVYPVDAIKH
jgi:predicted dehydrogenase